VPHGCGSESAQTDDVHGPMLHLGACALRPLATARSRQMSRNPFWEEPEGRSRLIGSWGVAESDRGTNTPNS
jgi:hypothetical protein